MVSLQVCLVKQRREKSAEEGNFSAAVVAAACYNEGLTVAAGGLAAVVMHQTRGSVDYPSTHLEYKSMSGYPMPLQKIGQSLLCTGNSTQIQHLHETCPKQSNIITMIQIWIKTASWAHTTISIKTYQLYPIVLRVQMFHSYTTYIKILEF